MTDDRGAVWRRRYGRLLHPDTAGAPVTIDIDPGLDRSELRERLRAEFAANPHAERVLIRVEGIDVGSATRAEAGRDPGHAGAAEGSLDLGSGDGATLPGHPAQFRALSYRCRRPGCRETALRSFHDERFRPLCREHGAMDLRP